MWDYAKANKDEIRECLSNFDWDSKFENLSVNDMVSELTTSLCQIFCQDSSQTKLPYVMTKTPVNYSRD